MPNFDPSEARVASGILPNLGTAVGTAVNNTVNNAINSVVTTAVGSVTTGVAAALNQQLGQLGDLGKNPIVSAAWSQLSGQLGSVAGDVLTKFINGTGWINAADLGIYQNGNYQTVNSPNLLSGGREKGLPEHSIKITGVLGSFVFPVTPQITVTHSSKYSPASLSHTIYSSHFYEGSEVGAIQINADCPCQTQDDAKALMAGIFILRAYTKMYYGASSNTGSPPPLAFLHGYGEYFNKVPCIVTNVQHTLPDNVDYINSGKIWVPTSGQVSVALQPVYSRDKLEKFNLNTYAVGGLIGDGFI
jgi:hypothetical protein